MDTNKKGLQLSSYQTLKKKSSLENFLFFPLNFKTFLANLNFSFTKKMHESFLKFTLIESSHKLYEFYKIP